MKIIKEFCPANNVAIIRSDSRGSTLSYIMTLFHEAQKDFPEIDYKDVTVVHYGGQQYAKTFGIEFDTDGQVPDDYMTIAELEYTL